MWYIGAIGTKNGEFVVFPIEVFRSAFAVELKIIGTFWGIFGVYTPLYFAENSTLVTLFELLND